ncbi:MAG: hypothetical protein NZ772_15155, partial [Cyanobacteria bacterium]|nr:hypothetical protein [Cyanobacteriota bacterium]MDW8202654.1 hypothetical protein [Cyanobacteriota bacterium SKYGB_h_bin112]
ILRHWLTAVITIGLALALGGATLAEGRLGIAPNLSLWLLALAIAITLLWLVKIWSSRYDRPLAQLYGQALDGWAVLLCGCELYLLTASAWRVYGALPATSVLVIAGALTMLAPAYRSWQPPRQSSHQWLSILAMGVVQLALVEFSRTRLVALAIATVLMIIHTHLLRQIAAAVFTIGYGLALSGAILMELPRPAGNDWWLVPVLAIASLWLGRD